MRSLGISKNFVTPGVYRPMQETDSFRKLKMQNKNKNADLLVVIHQDEE